MFGCVIKGKIIVSPREWGNIKKHLRRTRKWLYSGHDPKWYKREVLEKDFERFERTSAGRIVGRLYNIRVYATAEIARKYGLKRYKRQNYMFLVRDQKLSTD